LFAAQVAVWEAWLREEEHRRPISPTPRPSRDKLLKLRDKLREVMAEVEVQIVGPPAARRN
jgi:hypothetical protein